MQHHDLILLVDDDYGTAELLAFVLRGEEYDVARASDVDTALQLAHSRRPSVVVLDLEPPQRERQFVRSLRSDPELGNVPIVVLAGAEELARLDGDACVSKPLGKSELLQVIAEVFRFVPPSRRPSRRRRSTEQVE